MSLYALIGQDRENSLQLRQQVRPAHLARVAELSAQGRIVVAGPFPAIDADEGVEGGFTGSLIVAEFESLEEARQWFSEDPYVREGVFETHDVRPFRQVLP